MDEWHLGPLLAYSATRCSVNTQALIYRVQSAARTTGNLAVICVGLAILGGVPYFLFSDLLGSEGHIRWFSDALQRIRHDPDVIKYVGTPIKGYGDPGSRMARNRTINHTLTRDARGVEHLLIRFYIEGPKDTGTVKLELSKDARGAWHYNYILVEVPGHGRSSWRIVVDTSRPAPPPAWRETLADTQAFIVTEGCRAWHVTKQCSLVAYDHARDWIASFRDR
ncbi:mitochondrial import inner membrane translocase subunit tim21 [Tieghemiomyces parasiticus]|uniref:Mitochondrial import inner membrane translocase subunit Tim21 n=1 Tax=Tieghemiomyces parasiticus TaxID=78921 RepID=A0A9W7ZSP6_9FUNG|nr:mitochondrial import inner membrane translocase subunit tim21 [Tieghemiomyces parasiticus]